MNIKQQTRQQPVGNKKLGISNKLNMVDDYVICKGKETRKNKNKNCEEKKKIINKTELDKIINKTELDKIIVEDDTIKELDVNNKMDNIIVENNTVKELYVNDKTDNIKKSSYELSMKKLLSKTGKITLNYECVSYNGKDCVVFKINTSMDVNNLVVIDADDFDKIKYLTWYIQNNGYICTQNSSGLKLYLHCLIMGRTSYEDNKLNTSVDHINRIRTDNRKENLRLATNTEQRKNQEMRTRGNGMPENIGVNKTDIPRCVWYIKSKPTKGDGFRIRIKKFNNVDLTSNLCKDQNVSLKLKFEQIKKELRYIKELYPDEFEKHYIEYEHNQHDIELIEEFNTIIKLSEFQEKTKCQVIPNRKNYIKEDFNGMNNEEIEMLKTYDPALKNGKKIKSSLPKDCDITQNMIPRYCYYTIQKSTSACKFRIDDHPGLHKKSTWDTTSSDSVSIQEKFRIANERILMLNQIPKGCYYNKECGNKKSKNFEKFTIEKHPKLINGFWTSSFDQYTTRQEKLDELLEMYNVINKLPDYCYYNAGVHAFEIIDHPKLKVKNKIIKIENNLINNKFNELQELLLNLELL